MIFSIVSRKTIILGTHNVCFRSKIRKIGIPLQTPAFLYEKRGVKGVHISRTCFLDEFLSTASVKKTRLMTIHVQNYKKDKCQRFQMVF